MASAKPTYGASVEARPKRDGSVSYDVRYRIDGSSKRNSFGTPEAAEKWAGVVRSVGPAQALEYLKITSAPGTPTVDEYAETYIASKSGIEPRTRDDYRTYMRLHISPTLGHLPMDAVSPATISAWVNENQAAGAASKTVKNWHGFMSAMFQNAVYDNIITRNPCARTKLLETEKDEMIFLSPDEFAVLLSYIPPKYQPLVQFLATTGVRWGEAIALRASDFDLDATDRYGNPDPTVRISRAFKWSRGKGWYIGPPKTKRSNRTVTLSEDMLPALRDLIAEGHEYVFTNSFGRPIRQSKFYETVWAPARRMANGLPPFDRARSDDDKPWTARPKGVWHDRKPAAKPIGKFPRVHDLRHSHISWLLADGVGIDVVSRRVGHESIETTVGTYGHIAEGRARGAARSIGITLAGALSQVVDSA